MTLPAHPCRRCKEIVSAAHLVPLGKYKQYICRPCNNADQRRNHKNRDKDVVRNSNLKRRYGITLKEYQETLVAQKGLCAICETPPGPRDRFILHVDHCHSTEVVRGLLCIFCNTALGKFNDDPSLLRKAADYIERSRVQ